MIRDRRRKDSVEYEQKLNEWQNYAREWEEKDREVGGWDVRCQA